MENLVEEYGKIVQLYHEGWRAAFEAACWEMEEEIGSERFEQVRNLYEEQRAELAARRAEA